LEVVLTNAFGEPANDKEALFFFAYFESLDLDVFLKWFMILCVVLSIWDFWNIGLFLFYTYKL